MKLLLSFSLFLLTACAGLGSNSEFAEDVPTLTVIATSDFHGALESEEATSLNGRKVEVGGGPMLASYLKTLKERVKGPVLWVDGGDLFQGSMASNRFEGAPVIRLFNHLGLHAAALGNHEFDYGPKGAKAVPRSKGDDPRGALKARVNEAKFPFLAANVRDESGGVPVWVRPSHIVNFPEVRVGIVGAAAPDTPSTTNALNLEGLHFLDPVPAVREEAQRLRDQGADVVVLVMHIGTGCEDNDLDTVDDLGSCGPKAAINLVRALPEGLVDVAVAGHTHRGAMKRVNKTMLLQGFSHGRYLAWAEVPLQGGVSRPGGMAQVCRTVLNAGMERTCDPYRVRKLAGEVEPASFLGKTMEPDPEAEKILRPELTQVKKIMDRRLGVSVRDPFPRSYSAESPLGNLVADLTRAAGPSVDLGMSNGGGLRADLPAGPLTYGTWFNVTPFDNQLAVMRVTGAELEKLVHQGLFGGQGVYSFSSNLRGRTRDCEIESLTVNGKKVDPKKIYSIATSDFLAMGGSGVRNVGIRPENVKVYWDANYILRDVIAEYLAKRKGVLKVSDYYRPDRLRIVKRGNCRSEAPRKD